MESKKCPTKFENIQLNFISDSADKAKIGLIPIICQHSESPFDK
jgi:hypothetical protein